MHAHVRAHHQFEYKKQHKPFILKHNDARDCMPYLFSLQVHPSRHAALSTGKY